MGRIPKQDYQKLTQLAAPMNPKKVWIKGDLTVKKATPCKKFFWGLFERNRLKNSEKAFRKLKAEIVIANNPKLEEKFNKSIDNFQAVHKTHNSALNSLKFKPQPVVKPIQLQPVVTTQPVNPIKPKPTPVIVPPQVNTTAKKVHYTVGTYNILFPQRDYQNVTDKLGRKMDHTHPHATDIGYHENDQGDIVENSEYRIKVITQNIQNANLDVNCLQEVSKEAFETLQKNLSDKYVGVWAPHKGPLPKTGSTYQANNQGVEFIPQKADHGVAIFYKKDQFNMLQSYSSRFDLPGIRKRHLMLDLQDKKSGLTTRYVTCHLTDPGQWAKNDKTQHINSVLSTAHRNYNVDMIVVTGDMNQDQFGDKDIGKPRKPADLLSATAFEPLVASGYKHGAEKLDQFPSTEVNREGATHNDKDYSPTGKLKDTGRMIDHIFMKTVNPNIKPTIKFKGIPQDFNERGSDHKMVVSRISV